MLPIRGEIMISVKVRPSGGYLRPPALWEDYYVRPAWRESLWGESPLWSVVSGTIPGSSIVYVPLDGDGGVR